MIQTNNKIQSSTFGHKSGKLWKFQERVKKQWRTLILSWKRKNQCKIRSISKSAEISLYSDWRTSYLQSTLMPWHFLGVKEEKGNEKTMSINCSHLQMSSHYTCKSSLFSSNGFQNYSDSYKCVQDFGSLQIILRSQIKEVQLPQNSCW